MSVNNRVIVVTGASAGLGRVMADAFVEAGATVVCAARDESRLEATVAELNEHRGTAKAIPVDVRSWSSMRSLVESTVSDLGRIDVFVNNAGVKQAVISGRERRVVDVPVSHWKTVIDTNLTGAFYGAKAVLRHMLDRKSGRLIHLTSEMGVKGRARRAPYAASKFGLEGLHESLAEELEGTGVSSVLLDPGGGVNTGFADHLDDDARSTRLQPSIVREPALALAKGDGQNGGRYVATDWR